LFDIIIKNRFDCSCDIKEADFDLYIIVCFADSVFKSPDACVFYLLQKDVGGCLEFDQLRGLWTCAIALFLHCVCVVITRARNACGRERTAVEVPIVNHKTLFMSPLVFSYRQFHIFSAC